MRVLTYLFTFTFQYVWLVRALSNTGTLIKTRFHLFGKESETTSIHLQLSPLIGGPKWLPLHCKLILTVKHTDSQSAGENQHSFDFVPAKPTHPSTLTRLVTLQPVTAVVRYQNQALSSLPTSDQIPTTGVKRIDAALDFARTYQPDTLHLLHNNCYTFAARLYQNITHDLS